MVEVGSRVAGQGKRIQPCTNPVHAPSGQRIVATNHATAVRVDSLHTPARPVHAIHPNTAPDVHPPIVP